MHRTNRVPRAPLGGLLLLSLVFGGFVAVAQAQDEVAPAPQVAAATGATTLTLQAPDEVAPPPKMAPTAGGSALIVSINDTRRVQMKTKQRIRTALNERDQIALITELKDDPTSILIRGLTPGTTRITLTDIDGKTETFDVIVQFDVDYLKTLLQRAVPTANIVPIPGSQGSIILTGYVAHSEDVDTVLRIAASVVGANAVINALRVGGVMQVQLDVVIAEVNRQETRYMDFEFWKLGLTTSFSNGMSGLQLPSSGLTTSNGTVQYPNIIGQVNAAPMNLFLGVLKPTQDFFGFLQLLRDEGVAKLLTQPKLVTLSGRPAHFVSGGEVPIPAAGGLGTTTVTFKPIGTLITLLPVVLGNGKIHLEVEPEFSQRNNANGIDVGGTVIPGFDTRRVRTAVEMESGQTLAIGGLIEHRSQTNMRKVPFLGDLPFLGTAFSSKFNNETEVELLFLVTPHLVDPMSCDQAPKVLPGQETRVPDDFELYLEGIQEAPRGCRDVFVNHHYLAAYKNSPTVGTYPCCPGCPQHGHGPIGAGAGCGCGGGGNEAVGVSGVVTSTVSTPVVGTVNEVAPPPAHPVAAGHVQRTTAPTVVPALPVSSSLPMGMESGAYPVQKPLPAPVGAAGNP